MKTSQKTADKGLVTRTKLLDSAYAILRDHGHAALRFGTVSDLAGVSRGGLLHHFPTKQHLVAAVFDDIIRKMEAESWRRINSFSGDVLDAIAEDAKCRFFGPSYLILLDILVSCAQEDELEAAKQKLASELGARALDGWQQQLEATGYAPIQARRTARFLWNLVRGLAIRSTVQADPDYFDRTLGHALHILRAPCLQH